MTKADNLAIWTKAKIAILAKENLKPRRIILGYLEMLAITTNNNPCNPPDYLPDGKKPATFCGIEVVEAGSFAELVAFEL